MTPDRTDCPPEPVPVGYCVVCREPVYKQDMARTWTDELVHPECKPRYDKGGA